MRLCIVVEITLCARQARLRTLHVLKARFLNTLHVLKARFNSARTQSTISNTLYVLKARFNSVAHDKHDFKHTDRKKTLFNRLTR
jgi:hypothetical protein